MKFDGYDRSAATLLAIAPSPGTTDSGFDLARHMSDLADVHDLYARSARRHAIGDVEGSLHALDAANAKARLLHKRASALYGGGEPSSYMTAQPGDATGQSYHDLPVAQRPALFAARLVEHAIHGGERLRDYLTHDGPYAENWKGRLAGWSPRLENPHVAELSHADQSE